VCAANVRKISTLRSRRRFFSQFPYAKKAGKARFQTVDKKLFSPFRGRIALSTNERIAEFLDFVLQAKLAYVSKLKRVFSAS